MASSISAGTTSSTALVCTADTTGALQLATNNGTVAVTVDTSQNVGIGTTSPQAKFHVSNSGATGMEFRVADGSSTNNSILSYNRSTSAYNDLTISTNNTIFAYSGVEKMRIDSSGNVGIGTTTIGQKLVIESNSSQLRLRNTTTRYRSDYNIDSSGNTEINSYDDTGSAYKQIKLNGSPLIFSVGSEAMRIDASGNVLVGKTASSLSTSGFEASASGMSASNAGASCGDYNRNTNDGQVINFRRQGSGVGNISVTGSATAFNTSSDYRLKQNIAPMTGALAKVAALKPVTYKWKVDGSDGQGFIAHELDEVVPGCVTGAKDAVDANGNPEYQSIDTSFLVATLTAAIQELTAKVTALEAKVGASA